MEHEEVSAIAVKSRIPTFWRDKPQLWFAQFETVVNPQKPSDEAKFSLMVAHIEKEDIEQIGDILMNTSNGGRYEDAKKRLLSVYEESETKQLHDLLNEMDLGDQKPSQLLRRMRELARGKMPDSTLQLLWMRHLPTATRTVLSVNDKADIDVLAAMADKMQEQAREVNSVCICQRSSTSRGNDLLNPQDLRDAIMQLTEEVAAIKMNYPRGRQTRQPFNRWRPRSRSRGRPQHQYQKRSSDMCYYHEQFGEEARNCRPPCKFAKRQGN